MIQAEKLQKINCQNKTPCMKLFIGIGIAINLISRFSAVLSDFVLPLNTPCQYDIFLSMRNLF